MELTTVKPNDKQDSLSKNNPLQKDASLVVKTKVHRTLERKAAKYLNIPDNSVNSAICS